MGLERLQIEHDSAKSVHTMPECTLVDLNRAGIGLVEIVTKPDMENGAEAAAFVRELIAILDCIGTCDCNLAEGSLRVDANVSVHHPDVAHSGVSWQPLRSVAPPATALRTGPGAFLSRGATAPSEGAKRERAV